MVPSHLSRLSLGIDSGRQESWGSGNDEMPVMSSWRHGTHTRRLVAASSETRSRPQSTAVPMRLLRSNDRDVALNDSGVSSLRICNESNVRPPLDDLPRTVTVVLAQLGQPFRANLTTTRVRIMTATGMNNLRLVGWGVVALIWALILAMHLGIAI